jgi:hypothetical protein
LRPYRGTVGSVGLLERSYREMEIVLGTALIEGLVVGLILALRNGGWFVLLQRVAHRRLARAGNLPSPPHDFLEWGIERQIFRRVGGGVRFRHNLIQQHLARSHLQQPREAEARSETRGPKLAFAGVFLALAVWDTVAWVLEWAFRDLLRLAVIMLVASGVAYLFLMRRQGVTFREVIFNWPMAAVAGVVAFVLRFWPV